MRTLLESKQLLIHTVSFHHNDMRREKTMKLPPTQSEHLLLFLPVPFRNIM